MATSNIQKTGLESAIYFIEPNTSEENINFYKTEEPFENYNNDEILELLYENFNESCENYYPEAIEEAWGEIELELYSHYYENYVRFTLKIEIEACYYEWINLIITSSEDLENLDFSNTSLKKIERGIKKLEKIMSNYSTKLRTVFSFSNWETFYEKI